MAGIAGAALASVAEQQTGYVPSTIDNLFFVEIDRIQTVKQPRESFGGEEDEQLAESIRSERRRENGVAGTGFLQPLLLRPDRFGTGYYVVAGERRLRAANKIGLKEVPALIENMSPSDAWRAAIIENVQRKQLTPKEEAKAYQAMMEAEGLNKAELAREMNKSASYITELLALLKHPEDLQLMVDKQPATTRAARELAKLPEATRAPIVRRLSEGESYNSVKSEIEDLKTRQQVQAKIRAFEVENAQPIKPTPTTVLPRVPFPTLAERLDYDSKEALDVCLQVMPKGQQKRDMLVSTKAVIARLQELEKLLSAE